jgi:hypothetical protein
MKKAGIAILSASLCLGINLTVRADDKPEAKTEAAPATTTVAADPKVAAAEAEAAAKLAREKGKNAVEMEHAAKAAIKRLATSGYREAQGQILALGKAAIPHLIEALACDTPVAAYNLGGHTKANAGRATRQLTLAEVCCEVLTDLVQNHSDFKGEVPTVDARAWQTWWAANADTINIGK